VRHAGGYVTNYLHLSRFATGMRGGVRVSQGDVIGYVGQTGLASGPHLDYRVQKNGGWINPTSLGGVQAAPIPASSLAAFHRQRDDLRARLNGLAPVPLERPAIAEVALPGDVGATRQAR